MNSKTDINRKSTTGTLIEERVQVNVIVPEEKKEKVLLNLFILG
jgi:hypothetical protein